MRDPERRSGGVALDAQKAQRAQVREADKPAMHDLKQRHVAEHREDNIDTAKVELRGQLDRREAALLT